MTTSTSCKRSLIFSFQWTLFSCIVFHLFFARFVQPFILCSTFLHRYFVDFTYRSYEQFETPPNGTPTLHWRFLISNSSHVQREKHFRRKKCRTFFVINNTEDVNLMRRVSCRTITKYKWSPNCHIEQVILLIYKICAHGDRKEIRIYHIDDCKSCGIYGRVLVTFKPFTPMTNDINFSFLSMLFKRFRRNKTKKFQNVKNQQ